MTYATELVQLYRQALHHLWNMHFWAPSQFRDYVSVKQFNRVKLPLFLSLVVDRLGSDLEDPQQIFGDAFKVVPPLAPADGSIPSLMIEDPQAKGVWRTVNGPFRTRDLKLCLLDFFDWQEEDWRDFRYFLVRVDAMELDSSWVGCNGLVEVGYVDVLWEPPGILGLPRPRIKIESASE